MKTYVNLGCGRRFGEEWINFDLVSTHPLVRAADLSKGIPLSDGVADLVYHSAVLEHIRPEHVPGFLRECGRVLRSGGILRIGVPDFERICREYLALVERGAAGDESVASDYEWLVLEMVDQMVREAPGGAMKDYLSRSEIPNLDFVIARIGEEGRELREHLLSRPAAPSRIVPGGWWKNARRIIGAARRALASTLLTKSERHALQVGRFRMNGELHQWIYDRYSLFQLLKATGFVSPAVVSARESSLSEWSRIGLDVTPEGRVVKPDLIFVEAIKP